VMYDVVNEVAGAKPETILKMTHTASGGPGVDHWSVTTLFLQLEDDGTVEWEDWAGRGDKGPRKTAHLADDQWSKFKTALLSTNSQHFTKEMGPFAVYTDSGVDLKIEASLPSLPKSFVVQNPFPCGLPSCGYPAPKMPTEVQQFLCTAEQIRNVVDPTWKPRLCGEFN